MIKRISKHTKRSALVVSLIVIGLVITVTAQGTGTTATTKAPAAEKTLSPKEELTSKLRSSMKNPAEFTAVLAELLNKYPYDEQGVSYLYSLTSSMKYEKDPQKVRSLIDQLVKNTGQVPAPLKADIYRYSANVLYSNKLYADAADLSQKNIDLLDESQYIDFKRKQFDESYSEDALKRREKQMQEAMKNNPELKKRYEEMLKTPRKPPEFGLARARVDFIGLKTTAYNTLGKSLWEQGKFVDAEKAYRDSLAVKVTKESALGIAKAAEKNGKDGDALKYATVAALTGKLVPDEMNYFYSVYAKQHKGKTDDVEEYLNAEFRKTYHNPVTGKKYERSANRSDRTVLVEFVTGAGCIPCILYDYTFERALEDYSRRDVAFVVYDTHAPTMDPLGNNSSDARYNYYDLHGAPNVFIDGKKFEGEDDYNGSEEEKSEIQPVADSVFKELNSDLEIPAEAKLELHAKQDGRKVTVNVEAGGFKNVSDDVTLHLALVQNETAYSGENGLRFHPMVVRALAGNNDKRVFGFKVDPTKANKFEYVFDVDKIEAQNLAYYDAKQSEMMKEFLGRMGGKMPEGMNISFGFNYKENQIDAKQLSVVAFLQDNKTKKILQSSFVNLASK